MNGKTSKMIRGRCKLKGGASLPLSQWADKSMATKPYKTLLGEIAWYHVPSQGWESSALKRAYRMYKRMYTRGEVK